MSVAFASIRPKQAAFISTNAEFVLALAKIGLWIWTKAVVASLFAETALPWAVMVGTRSWGVPVNTHAYGLRQRPQCGGAAPQMSESIPVAWIVPRLGNPKTLAGSCQRSTRRGCLSNISQTNGFSFFASAYPKASSFPVPPPSYVEALCILFNEATTEGSRHDGPRQNSLAWHQITDFFIKEVLQNGGFSSGQQQEKDVEDHDESSGTSSLAMAPSATEYVAPRFNVQATADYTTHQGGIGQLVWWQRWGLMLCLDRMYPGVRVYDPYQMPPEYAGDIPFFNYNASGGSLIRRTDTSLPDYVQNFCTPPGALSVLKGTKLKDDRVMGRGGSWDEFVGRGSAGRGCCCTDADHVVGRLSGARQLGLLSRSLSSDSDRDHSSCDNIHHVTCSCTRIRHAFFLVTSRIFRSSLFSLTLSSTTIPVGEVRLPPPGTFPVSMAIDSDTDTIGVVFSSRHLVFWTMVPQSGLQLQAIYPMANTFQGLWHSRLAGKWFGAFSDFRVGVYKLENLFIRYGYPKSFEAVRRPDPKTEGNGEEVKQRMLAKQKELEQVEGYEEEQEGRAGQYGSSIGGRRFVRGGSYGR